MTDAGDDDAVVVEALTPEESFECLAHEIRMETVRVLDEEGPLSHSDLREAVGVADSGQFNYHLQKLDGQFVRKDEDGYELTPAGRRVVGAVVSGSFTAGLEGKRVPSDAECFRCGGTLATHIEEGSANMTCTDCGQQLNSVDIPPRVLEGSDPADLHGLVDRWVKRRVSSVEYGFCHRCDGPVEEALVPATDDEAPDGLADLPVEAICHERCPRCGVEYYSLIPGKAALHPASMGFHFEHGIDIRETPMADLDWLEMGVTDVESTDPLRVSVPMTLDAETFVLTFDQEMSLVEDRRH
ncbi:winged helix-turn-helix domain-containing protein [Halobacteriales archaeon Cl-PHB]